MRKSVKRLLSRRTAPATAAALPVANLLPRAAAAAYGTTAEFDTFGKAQRRHCWQKIDFPAFPVFPAESVVWQLKTDPHG